MTIIKKKNIIIFCLQEITKFLNKEEQLQFINTNFKLLNIIIVLNSYRKIFYPVWRKKVKRLKKKKKRGEREEKNKKLDSLVTLLNFLFPNLWRRGKMIFNKLNNHHNISSKLTPKKKKELKKKKTKLQTSQLTRNLHKIQEIKKNHTFNNSFHRFDCIAIFCS